MCELTVTMLRSDLATMAKAGRLIGIDVSAPVTTHPESCNTSVDAEALTVLRERFDYDPDTGVFRWKIRPRNHLSRIGDRAGYISDQGYEHLSVGRSQYRAHRVAWLFVYGHWPKGQIDHINHVRHDNRICNLRVVSNAENHKNTKKPSDNTSGFTGISFNKNAKKWNAYIKANGKKTHLGYFSKIEDAKRARTEALRAYEYHDNHGEELSEPLCMSCNRWTDPATLVDGECPGCWVLREAT